MDNKHSVLADEMGLGKTVQAITAIKSMFEKSGTFRCLIVVPNSLLFNWISEFKVWFKETSPTVLVGNKKNRYVQLDMDAGIILATYEQIRIAIEENPNLRKFDLVVLDEAQRLKNKSSKTYLMFQLLKKDKTWLLTGTPLENNLQDIVSLFRFMSKKILTDPNDYLKVKNEIKPFIKRRMKKDVAKELPDLIEQEIILDLSPQQKTDYLKIYEQRKNYDSMFEVLNELKQVCNFSKRNQTSSKLEMLEVIIEDVYENDGKVLVFSQYVDTLLKIQKHCNFDNVEIFHGGLSRENKNRIIQNFKSTKQSSTLLVSIKAGSVGLNLQEASTVVLFDRWWNPAVENQAIGRAHRIGSDEPVTAYKFLTQDTIEQKLDLIINSKMQLFDQIINEEEFINQKINLKELLDL